MSGLRLGIVLWALLFSGLAHASYSFDDSPRASDEELDRMRGGFIVNLNGLEFLMAFSLERLTYINGELVSSVTLNPFALTPLEHLGKIGQMVAGLTAKPSASVEAAAGLAASGLPGASTSDVRAQAADSSVAQAVASAASSSTSTGSSGLPSGGSGAAPLTQQSGAQAALDTVMSPGAQDNSSVASTSTDAGNSEAVASASQLTQSQTGTTETAQSSTTTTETQVGQSSAATASATVASTSLSPQVTSLGTLTVVQNGPGNSITLPANISAAALTTVIQNSLNDQVIRNVTIMNATIASKMLEAQARLDAMLNQSLNGLR